MNRRNFLVQAAWAGGAAASGTELLAAAPATAGKATDAGSLVVNGLDASIFSREYVLMTRAAGVDCTHKTLTNLLSFADMHNFVDTNSDVIRVVRSVAEIRQAKQDRKLGLLLGWQTADPVSNGRNDGYNNWWDTPTRTELRAYYELGLRFCGIAYQIANVFGGGATDGSLGLSRAGRALVEEIHKLRIILDVGGHTGDRASLDALAMSSGVPIVSTHVATRHFANSSRNISDELIDAIAKSGGVIGVPAINDFVMRGKDSAHLDRTPQGTLDDMLNHYDYIKARVGAEHVGLGPDFTFGQDGVRDTPMFGPEAVDRNDRRFVTGFENISKLANLVDGLRRHGWNQQEIQGLLGDNWIRVYQKVWGA